MNPDPLLLSVFFVLGAISFCASTLFGGGGALLALPLANALAGPLAAPILNLGSLIGRPVRLLVFWRYIDWRVVAWYTPFAVLGAWLGGLVFTSSNLGWLIGFVAAFLIVSGGRIIKSHFRLRAESTGASPSEAESNQALGGGLSRWAFAPAGLVVSVVSTMVGAVGPVLNPLYLKAGITREGLIATKTACSFLMGLAQVAAYSVFLKSSPSWASLGVAFGVGAALGSWISKRWLGHMSTRRFELLVGGFLVVSGALMLMGV